MRKAFISIFCIALAATATAQCNEISSMRWGADFNIHITFSNDSTSILDVRGLYHSTSTMPQMAVGSEEVTYYPVTLDPEFVDALKNKKLESFDGDTAAALKFSDTVRAKTLWSALHGEIGGGYIHFINCLIYSLESKSLNLWSPFYRRPESNWKPKPMTESYRRTKNWKYYFPDNQKLAHKEYLTKQKNGELGDMQLLPKSFIDLFLGTNQKQYEQLKADGETNKVAIIDMIRLLVSANYLGLDQISLIQGAVSRSIMKYSMNSLPSVIIFDDFGAAVAMTLDHEGYKIDNVVFNQQETLSADEIDQRMQLMQGVIRQVNAINKKLFERNLKSYYK
ncbi:MAG: hypothetical protein IKO46_00450 [Salinivirgaceae bacterium]|nr:hypothetical protein [Salinivirgaceae bacterium]MBR6081322.1 hypothetical protein [Salinivirgaceae bacterium]